VNGKTERDAGSARGLCFEVRGVVGHVAWKVVQGRDLGARFSCRLDKRVLCHLLEFSVHGITICLTDFIRISPEREVLAEHQILSRTKVSSRTTPAELTKQNASLA
jgi:hypothetical protein